MKKIGDLCRLQLYGTSYLFVRKALTGELCSELNERVSIIVTTNLRFAEWNQVFGDEKMTGALLDRLTHRASILEFVGESYRFRQRLLQEEPERTLGENEAS